MKAIRIIELTRKAAPFLKQKHSYETSSYYDLSISREGRSWQINLTLKPLEKTLTKGAELELFGAHVEEPRVFTAETEGKRVGWLELGYHSWNNRMRVWQLLVHEDFRRRGIATLLMQKAVEVAKERGARMLVLETQTCNIPAISFYLKSGFELIGFDTTHYSNEDIQKKEVRLEFGLKL